MFRLIQAELLKIRRSAGLRLSIGFPLALGVFSLVQMGYFSTNLLNWDCVVFLPATIALVGAFAIGMETGQMGMRGMCTLPVAQWRLWTAKFVVLVFEIVISALLVVIPAALLPLLLNLVGISQGHPIPLVVCILAGAVMFWCASWQIPLAMLLARRIGAIGAVLVAVVASIAGVVAAPSSWGLFIPWSWPSRALITVAGIMPNGLVAEAGDPLISGVDLGLCLIFSAALFGALTIVCIAFLSRKEVV